MAKIINITGNSDSGRKTFAINLATILDQKEYRVCVMSTNKNYGDIQHFFDEIVDVSEGLEKALNDNLGQKLKKLKRLGEKKANNIYLLTMPNRGPEIKEEYFDADHMEELYRELNAYFSYIILVSDVDPRNEISTFFGLELFNYTFCIFKPGVKALNWWKSASTILETDFKKKPIFVMTDMGNFTTDQFANLMHQKFPHISFSFALPWVAEAEGYENNGTPIVKSTEKSAKKYREKIIKITDFIESAEIDAYES